MERISAVVPRAFVLESRIAAIEKRIAALEEKKEPEVKPMYNCNLEKIRRMTDLKTALTVLYEYVAQVEATDREYVFPFAAWIKREMANG